MLVECSSSEVRCDASTVTLNSQPGDYYCIPRSLRCDWVTDCPLGEDEDPDLCEAEDDILTSKCLADILTSKCLADILTSKCLVDILTSKCLVDILTSKCLADILTSKCRADILTSKCRADILTSKCRADDDILTTKNIEIGTVS